MDKSRKKRWFGGQVAETEDCDVNVLSPDETDCQGQPAQRTPPPPVRERESERESERARERASERERETERERERQRGR